MPTILLITRRNSCAAIGNTNASSPGSQARGQAQGNPPPRVGWRAHGASNFPIDPAFGPDTAPAIWRTDCSACVITVTGPNHRWLQLVERLADDGVVCDRTGPSGRHIILECNGIRHRILLRAGSEREVLSYVLPADGPIALRCAAVSAFHHHTDQLAEGAHGRPFQPTHYQRHRLRIMLAALDARHEGNVSRASLRQVAAAVLGGNSASIRAIEWKTSSQRRQIQRLLGEGLHMAERGYRDLLNGRWPKRGEKTG